MVRVFTLLLALWAGPAAAEPVVVFAAASLKGPLDDVAEASDADVVIAYGASSALARQISLGAPADLFISANVQWAQTVPGDHIGLLSNRLVLIGPAGAEPLALTPAALEDRLAGGRLAIALTAAVPAGLYGREALETFGLWDTVQTQLAETAHVRAALALVVRGEAPLGLVYASDALRQPGVAVVARFPAEAHSPIHYTAVALSPAGEQLLQHLQSNPEPFLAAGFELP